MHAKVLFDFSRSLEDPVGFTRGLENAYKRQNEHTRIMSTGGAELDEENGTSPPETSVVGPSGGWENRHPGAQPSSTFPSDVISRSPGTSVDATGELGLNLGQCISVPNGSHTADSATSSSSRWEQIRVANARNAAQGSAWEAIRQSSGKAAIAARSLPANVNEENFPVNDRMRANGVEPDRSISQADFDAMLEAERSIAKNENDDSTPTWK
jgi:hypothetical protein